MVIGVERGLKEIKDHLKSMGHAVYSLDENRVFDAVVYQNSNILSIPCPPAVKSTTSTLQNGTFLINATGKKPEEIASILHQKTYSNIF